MKLQISDLKTDREWSASTGCTKAQFEKLLLLFTKSYLELYGRPVAERQAEVEVTPCLSSEEELLFFTLFSLKVGLTYDVLGFVSGMDGSNAKRNQTLGLGVLEHTLETAQCLASFGIAAKCRNILWSLNPDHPRRAPNGYFNRTPARYARRTGLEFRYQ